MVHPRALVERTEAQVIFIFAFDRVIVHYFENAGFGISKPDGDNQLGASECFRYRYFLSQNIFVEGISEADYRIISDLLILIDVNDMHCPRLKKDLAHELRMTRCDKHKRKDCARALDQLLQLPARY
jgi:hypothetical protein